MKLPFNIQPKRTPLQERALKKAKSLYDSDPEKYKDTMFCPYCGSPLIKSGKQRRMQTMSEHVSYPNATPTLKDEYVCSAEGLFEHQYLISISDSDRRLGCEFGILHSWNGGYEKGGSYTSDYSHELHELSELSIVNKRVIDEWFHKDYQHEHKNALNTFECQSQTSIYNTGLKACILLPAWLTFNLIRLKLDFHYTANNFGEVTSTSVTLGFLKKDKNFNNEFCIVGYWFWDTWSFLNDKAKRRFKLAKRITDEKEKAKTIAEAMNISGNESFIYRLHQDYMYLIHPNYAKLMKKYGYYKVSTWQIR